MCSDNRPLPRARGDIPRLRLRLAGVRRLVAADAPPPAPRGSSETDRVLADWRGRREWDPPGSLRRAISGARRKRTPPADAAEFFPGELAPPAIAVPAKRV